MYDILINNSVSDNVLITGKIINDATQIANTITFSIDVKDKLFDYNNLTNKEIKQYNDMTDIVIRYYSNDKLNLLNLNSLPNLTTLSFYNLKTSCLPNYLFKLKNIKNLSITTQNTKNAQGKKYTVDNIDSLKSSVDLEYLFLDYDIKEFPNCILSLTKLQTLVISTKIVLTIPNELCDLQDLSTIRIDRFNEKILKNNNKMIIFDWLTTSKTIMELADNYDSRNKTVNIEIPDDITELKILNCAYNSLDNLPNHLEKLSLGTNILFPLNNLPICLKKLEIYRRDVYLTKDFLDKNIKLPFDCELVNHH